MTRNLQSIDAIITRSVTVNVLGHQLELRLPVDKLLREIRELATASAKFAKEGEDIGEGIRLFNEVQIKGIAGCLDTDEETASRLLMASGGDRGDLALAVREFLGMGIAEEEGDEDDGDPPLSLVDPS